jgi:hypothetical protein
MHPRLLLVGRANEHGDVVLAADDDPYLAAVHRIERFVRRTPDISYVLHTSVVFAEPVRIAIGAFGGSLKDVPGTRCGRRPEYRS